MCMANASDTSATEQSACAHISVDEPLMQKCNVGPCEVYTWNVSDWGACNASCGGRAASCCLSSLLQIVVLHNQPNARLPLDAVPALCSGTRACLTSHVHKRTAVDHFAPASAFSPHAYTVTLIRALLIITS